MVYSKTYRKKRYNYKRRKTNYETLRKRSRKNIAEVVKEVISKKAESKCFAATFDALAGNAGTMYTTELTDVTQGVTQNSRLGAEIEGDTFELLLNVYNKTNNELFVRLAVLEQSVRGATGTITGDTGIYQDPAGNVTTYTNSLSITDNAPVMWPFDTQGSVKVLRDKVLILPKNNGGNEGSNKTIKWKIPWNKNIRFSSDANSGEYNQSKRVSLVAVAWAPVGGTQSTYTYQVDGYGKFKFKDM